MMYARQVYTIALLGLLIFFAPVRVCAAEVFRCDGGLFTTTERPGLHCQPLSAPMTRGIKGERVFGSLTAAPAARRGEKSGKSSGRPELHGRLFDTTDQKTLQSTTAAGVPLLQDQPSRRRGCGG